VRDLIFKQTAWEDYLYWQTQDKKTLKRIKQLLRDIPQSSFILIVRLIISYRFVCISSEIVR
jgi:Txe/YoeB family toxin of Txe-Axe toxin-antitoxin module